MLTIKAFEGKSKIAKGVYQGNKLLGKNWIIANYLHR
jgi:hypothetical protein